MPEIKNKTDPTRLRDRIVDRLHSQAQVRADIKRLQMGVNYRVHHIEPPKDDKKNGRVVNVLPEFITTLPQRLNVDGHIAVFYFKIIG